MSLRDGCAWPEALPLLLLAPLAWLLLWALDRARARRLARAVGPRAQALTPELSARRRRLRRALAAAGLLLALIALLQPRWGRSAGPPESRGVDIVVCLDVSQSMLARDLPPSRLLAARNEVQALAGRVRGDRMGLVVFAGEARLSVPLTHDMESLLQLLQLADPLSVRAGGTDLGAALESALALLPEGGAGGVVLLLSDGEDLAARGPLVAEQCRDRGVVVHCVGFGSALGSKIALEGAAGGGFLRDRAGAEVVSALDRAGLRRIAETTGGEFLEAAGAPAPLLDLYERRVLPMARASFEAQQRRERENRFQWPLLGAFLLWILELCWTDRRRA
ncbi:MAG: VWA domain-containing protein [Planctomycetota bacterium]|nr:MAG: VWA domain-containing protein [Planctomycetota bacterium]